MQRPRKESWTGWMQRASMDSTKAAVSSRSHESSKENGAEKLVRPPSLRRSATNPSSGHMQATDEAYGECMSFPDWLEDQLQFSKRLEAPLMKNQSIFSFSSLRVFSRRSSKKTVCEFYMHVHGAEGLPTALHGKHLLASWQRRDQAVETRPSPVQHGVVEVEQTLRVKCTLFTTQGSTAQQPKYAPKACTLFIIVLDDRRIEVGKHVLDLARILPAKLAGDQAPWTANFPLTGIAKGATLVVTFGYEAEYEKGVRMAARVDQKTYASFSEASSARTTPGGGASPRKFRTRVAGSADVSMLASAALEAGPSGVKAKSLATAAAEKLRQDLGPSGLSSGADLHGPQGGSARLRAGVPELVGKEAEEALPPEEAAWRVQGQDRSAENVVDAAGAHSGSLGNDAVKAGTHGTREGAAATEAERDWKHGLLQVEEEDDIPWEVDDGNTGVLGMDIASMQNFGSLEDYLLLVGGSDDGAPEPTRRAMEPEVAASRFGELKAKWKSIEATEVIGEKAATGEMRSSGVKARIAALQAQSSGGEGESKPADIRIGKLSKPAFLNSEEKARAGGTVESKSEPKVGKLSVPAFLAEGAGQKTDEAKPGELSKLTFSHETQASAAGDHVQKASQSAVSAELGRGSVEGHAQTSAEWQEGLEHKGQVAAASAASGDRAPAKVAATAGRLAAPSSIAALGSTAVMASSAEGEKEQPGGFVELKEPGSEAKERELGMEGMLSGDKRVGESERQESEAWASTYGAVSGYAGGAQEATGGGILPDDEEADAVAEEFLEMLDEEDGKEGWDVDTPVGVGGARTDAHDAEEFYDAPDGVHFVGDGGASSPGKLESPVGVDRTGEAAEPVGHQRRRGREGEEQVTEPAAFEPDGQYGGDIIKPSAVVSTAVPADLVLEREASTQVPASSLARAPPQLPALPRATAAEAELKTVTAAEKHIEVKVLGSGEERLTVALGQEEPEPDMLREAPKIPAQGREGDGDMGEDREDTGEHVRSELPLPSPVGLPVEPGSGDDFHQVEVVAAGEDLVPGAGGPGAAAGWHEEASSNLVPPDAREGDPQQTDAFAESWAQDQKQPTENRRSGELEANFLEQVEQEETRRGRGLMRQESGGFLGGTASPGSISSDGKREMEIFLSQQLRSRSPSPGFRAENERLVGLEGRAQYVGGYREAETGFRAQESAYEAPKQPWEGETGDEYSSGGEDELSAILMAAEAEHRKAMIAERSRARAKMLEDEETQALMQQYGVDRNAFESLEEPAPQPPGPSKELGAEGFSELPPLAEGLGSAIHTKDGGMLLSMMPANFKADEGRLVMQVSKPVVIPAGMGSSATEIIQHLAGMGADALTEQAHMLMPLDDVSGKSMAQILSDGLMALEGGSHDTGFPQYSRPAIEAGESGSVTGGCASSALVARHGGLAMAAHAGDSLATRQQAGLSLVTSRGDRQLDSGVLPEDFVSLDELAPLAISAIEQLAMEGLGLQADITNEEAPGVLEPLPMEKVKVDKRTGHSQVPGLEGPSRPSRGATLVEVAEDDRPTIADAVEAVPGGFSPEELAAMSAGVGGEAWTDTGAGLGEGGLEGSAEKDMDLMGMAISLDEWERLDAITMDEWAALDAGVYGDESMDQETLAIMAAHDETHREGDGEGWAGGDIVVGGQAQGSRQLVQTRETKVVRTGGGAMGNTVTLAMLVQLRDPFRNYEPVGAPMMALIQAERVLVPPPVKLGRPLNLKLATPEEEEEEARQVALIRGGRSQFKITGVHMMGLRGEDAAKKGWGTQKQSQAGSRWLLASGMGKGAKNPLLKKQTKAKANSKKGEALWSLSQKTAGSGGNWGQELAGKSPMVRNPNVILPNDAIRKR